ncbi:MAG: hypothetical protein FJZ58_06515 [Chlamydiae bacterium]|nr:hypothetical protein [Chlamydiota bacterium]
MINCTLASILALTLKELFPKTLLLGGGGSDRLFYCDAVLPSQVDSSVVQEIEERILRFIKQKRPMRICEMIPKNAREYFLSQGEFAFADDMQKNEDPTCYLLQLEGRLFPFPRGGELQDLSHLEAVSLFQQEPLTSGRGLRLYGKVFLHKEEKKEFSKRKKEFIRPPHQRLGRERKLFWEEEEGWFWTPKGLAYRENLLRCLHKALQEFGGVFVASYPPFEDRMQSHISYGQQEGKTRVLVCETSWFSLDGEGKYGLLDSPIGQENISHLFCKEKLPLEEVISCLHFMTKIFKILGFVGEIVLVSARGSRKSSRGGAVLLEALQNLSWTFSQEAGRERFAKIEWRVRDRLGIPWPISCLYSPQYREKEALACIPMAPFLSLERLLALMMENGVEYEHEE